MRQRLRLWEASQGKVVGYVELPEQVTTARFTPDGQLAVAGLFDASVYFYRVKQGLGAHSFHTKVREHTTHAFWYMPRICFLIDEARVSKRALRTGSDYSA